MDLPIQENVPLAPRTSLELGGRARYYVEARDERTLVACFEWAKRHGVHVQILGGGTNVVVPDEGIDALVVRMAQRGVRFRERGDGVHVTVRAGEPWDPVVRRSVEKGLAGLECLSGIPGLAGATPIQNVGAYGQEVSEVIHRVRVMDRIDLGIRRLPPEQCAFGYRDSFFKRLPDRFVVLSVTFALRPGGEPTVRYAELERALDGGERTLASVRDTVLDLRRGKSMVIDPEDENRRSVGSFFTNPVVTGEEADRVVRHAVDEGMAKSPDEVPRWPLGDDRVKLAAGWLIERAGVSKGRRRGPVGVSSRHALSLVHHGGGTTGDLLALARDVRDTVERRFGVTLLPEPVLLAPTGDRVSLASAPD